LFNSRKTEPVRAAPSARLTERTADRDPIRQFHKWLHAAKRAHLHEPTAMTLATCTRRGRPSARMVLLKDADERGFVFYTNYESRKGREIFENPRAALVFHWAALNRQVRVTGRVSKVSQAESDRYFATRPLGSRVGAMASRQSSVIASRAVIENKFAEIAALYKMGYPAGGPPRPKHWGGYRVRPDEIEFWQGAENRLHDRLRYRRSRDGSWKMERLAP
jgi:pyridoxamine 5'-phosphate oxidase